MQHKNVLLGIVGHLFPELLSKALSRSLVLGDLKHQQGSGPPGLNFRNPTLHYEN